jgi:hypothetical protein
MFTGRAAYPQANFIARSPMPELQPTVVKK